MTDVRIFVRNQDARSRGQILRFSRSVKFQELKMLIARKLGLCDDDESFDCDKYELELAGQNVVIGATDEINNDENVVMVRKRRDSAETNYKPLKKRGEDTDTQTAAVVSQEEEKETEDESDKAASAKSINRQSNADGKDDENNDQVEDVTEEVNNKRRKKRKAAEESAVCLSSDAEEEESEDVSDESSVEEGSTGWEDESNDGQEADTKDEGELEQPSSSEEDDGDDSDYDEVNNSPGFLSKSSRKRLKAANNFKTKKPPPESPLQVLMDEKDVPAAPGKPSEMEEEGVDTSVATDCLEEVSMLVDGTGRKKADQSIKSRIIKLLNTGFHENSNENEAKNAMKLAQKLMRKHNLSQALLLKERDAANKRGQNGGNEEILKGGMVHVRIVNRKTGKPALYARWIANLSGPICNNFDVKCYNSVSRGRKCIVTFYGIYTNAQLAGYAFRVATERIAQMAAVYKPEPSIFSFRGKSASTKSAKLSYALGIVRGISQEVDKTLQVEKEKRLRKLQRARLAVSRGQAYEESENEDSEDDVDENDGPSFSFASSLAGSAKSESAANTASSSLNASPKKPGLHSPETKHAPLSGEELDRRLEELENEDKAAIVLVNHREKVAEDVLKDNGVKLSKGRKRKAINFDSKSFYKGIEDSKEIDINQRALRDEVRVKKEKRRDVAKKATSGVWKILILAVIASLYCCAALEISSCSFRPTQFRTNQVINPLALSDDRPRFSYALELLDGFNASHPVNQNLCQSAYQITCIDDATKDVLWDSGKVTSRETLEIEYEGKPLHSLMHVQWSVQVWNQDDQACVVADKDNGTLPFFETGLLEEEAWGGSRWIARFDELPVNVSLCSMMDKTLEENKVPRFRTTIQVEEPEKIVRVRAFIVGLGYYQMFIDNRRVGDSFLDPAWTTYSKRVLYATHDVTDMVAGNGKSKIAVGVELGNGEWNPLPMHFWGRINLREILLNGQGHPSSRPMFRLHMVAWYANGTTKSLVTSEANSSWRAGGSPTLFNNIYLGEVYDARLEPSFHEWSTVDFQEDKAGEWATPVLANAAGLGQLEAQVAPPIRRQRTLATTRITVRTDDITCNSSRIILFDTGLNHAGTCRIQVAPSSFKDLNGQRIGFRYGECLTQQGILNPNTSSAGGIYQLNPSVPCQPAVPYQRDSLILSNLSRKIDWTPSWSWHGFRYIEATIPINMDPDDLSIECYTMRTDVDVVLRNLTSSDPWLSSSQWNGRNHEISLLELVQNTLESNLMGIQTGCPHRERFGYGGDALSSGEAAMSIYDFSAFYRKRILDYNDAQRWEDVGKARKLAGFTETSPYVGISDGGLGFQTGPIGWDLYQPMGQTWLYKYYGDTRTLRDSWNHTKAFMDLLDSDPDGIEEGLGDWMPIHGTDARFSGRGFQRLSYLAYANISDILQKPTHLSQLYRRKADKLAKMLNKRFADAGDAGAYRVGTGKRAGTVTQTGQGYALFTGLIKDRDAQRPALAYMAADILNSSFIPGACHSTDFQPSCSEAGGGQGPHVTAGIFGMKWLLMALADGGLQDLAYDVMTTKSFPSFRWMTDNPFVNATTLWESYYFSDRLSQNHPMFASIAVWLVQSVVGIQPHPSARGMDHILIRPNPPSKMTHASANFATPRGMVHLSWRRFGNDSFRLETVIPPNCQATIFVPARSPLNEILQSGVPAEGDWVPSTIATSLGARVFYCGSGRHVFESLDILDSS